VDLGRSKKRTEVTIGHFANGDDYQAIECLDPVVTPLSKIMPVYPSCGKMSTCYVDAFMYQRRH